MPVKRGRPSAYDLMGPVIPAVPPGPPGDLEPEEQESWRQITERLPADWFTGENLPMLKTLCRHIYYADRLAQQINVLIAKPLPTDEDKKELRGLLYTHGRETSSIANLSTKLRLTQQARVDAESANQRQRRMPANPGKKPWEAWGDDDERPSKQ